MIALEDNAEDIIGKAMRGLALSPEALSQASGVSVAAITSLRRGDFDAAAARKIAAPLGLDAESLVQIGLGKWRPQPRQVEGLHQFRNEAGMAPNAYLVFHAGSRTALVFDTGEDATAMLRQIEMLGCGVQAIFITHTHGDHIACLKSLRLRFPAARVIVGRHEPLPGASLVDDGDQLQIGPLHIECRLTTGHSAGGITYVVDGLETTLAIVGDALFAGSIGGGMVSWTDALENNRRKIFTLPDESVVCPGHGPLTTIGEEKRHNPFYPEFNQQARNQLTQT